MSDLTDHLTDRLDQIATRLTACGDLPASAYHLVAALRAVLDVTGPHYAAMMRREAKFGRTRSSCCCEQCRAVHAVADALGVD